MVKNGSESTGRAGEIAVLLSTVAESRAAFAADRIIDWQRQCALRWN